MCGPDTLHSLVYGYARLACVEKEEPEATLRLAWSAPRVWRLASALPNSYNCMRRHVSMPTSSSAALTAPCVFTGALSTWPCARGSPESILQTVQMSSEFTQLGTGEAGAPLGNAGLDVVAGRLSLSLASSSNRSS